MCVYVYVYIYIYIYIYTHTYVILAGVRPHAIDVSHPVDEHYPRDPDTEIINDKPLRIPFGDHLLKLERYREDSHTQQATRDSVFDICLCII